MKRFLKIFLVIVLIINTIPVTVLADSGNYRFDEYGMREETKLKSKLTNNNWTEFDEKQNVLLDKEWTITFSGEVTEDKIEGMIIEKEDEPISVEIKIKEKNKATVRPTHLYEPNTRYCLKIILSNGKGYRMYFNTAVEEKNTGALLLSAGGKSQVNTPSGKKDLVHIIFDKSMEISGEHSILNKSNYNIDGFSLAVEDVEIVSGLVGLSKLDGTSLEKETSGVTIMLPSGFLKESNIKHHLEIRNAKGEEDSKFNVWPVQSIEFVTNDDFYSNYKFDESFDEDKVEYTDEKYFIFDKGTGTITGYNNYGPKNVVIPRVINGVTVTYIGNHSFRNSKLKSVSIPSSVTSIGDYAFHDNLLTEAIIPNSVDSIGNSAFRDNMISKLIIPNSVTSIRGVAFSGNMLSEIIIPNSITHIEESVFMSNRLKKITIPEGVISIGDNAFRTNVLSELNIPKSVTTIGKESFTGNRLTEVVLPVETTYIEKWPGNSFDIHNGYPVKIIKGKVEDSNDDDIKEDIESNYFTFDEKTGTITGYSKDAPKDVVIPSEINGISVTKIGNRAFDSKSIKSVVLPDSIKIIGDNSFHLNMIEKVTIPDSVTSIGYMSFANNILTEVTIPDNVTSIGTGAFSMNDLTEVVIPSGITIIEERTFSQNKLTRVTIPNNITTIGNNAFFDNRISETIIPNSVTHIGDEAFERNKLEKLIIPDSLTQIGNSTFKYNNLKEVIIPNSVTHIGDEAFKGNMIENVILPSSVTNLSSTAFDSKVTIIRE